MASSMKTSFPSPTSTSQTVYTLNKRKATKEWHYVYSVCMLSSIDCKGMEFCTNLLSSAINFLHCNKYQHNKWNLKLKLAKGAISLSHKQNSVYTINYLPQPQWPTKKLETTQTNCNFPAPIIKSSRTRDEHHKEIVKIITRYAESSILTKNSHPEWLQIMTQRWSLIKITNSALVKGPTRDQRRKGDKESHPVPKISGAEGLTDPELHRTPKWKLYSMGFNHMLSWCAKKRHRSFLGLLLAVVCCMSCKLCTIILLLQNLGWRRIEAKGKRVAKTYNSNFR